MQRSITRSNVKEWKLVQRNVVVAQGENQSFIQATEAIANGVNGISTN